MADTKLSALTPATVLTVDDYLYGVDDPTGSPVSAAVPVTVMQNAAGLIHTAMADADTTMAVGLMYTGSMAAWATADRTYTLPANAAVGDRIGICVTAGNASYELIIKPAASDTINGGSAAAEWSRLFITGECVILRCTTVNSAWTVEHDGRKIAKFFMELTTLADGENLATYTVPTAAATPGAWTARYDIGSLTTVASSLITARRACKMQLNAQGANKDAGTAGKYATVLLTLNGTTTSIISRNDTLNSAFGSAQPSVGRLVDLAAGDTVTYQYRNEEAGLGWAAAITTFFTGFEVHD
jgi:hypothetical protein